MRNVHFTDQEIAQILDCVVAVLNMGNVEFGFTDGDETPRPAEDSKDFITMAARLIGVDLTVVVKALTSKRQQLGRDLIESPLTIDQAYQARDSLCKHLYGNIFSWIVQKINASISVQTQAPQAEEGAKRPVKKNAK